MKKAFSLKILWFELVVVDRRCSDFPQRFDVDFGEFTLYFDTLTEKSKHIIADRFDWLSGFHLVETFYVVDERVHMREASLCLLWRYVHRELATSEVVAEWRWRIKD